MAGQQITNPGKGVMAENKIIYTLNIINMDFYSIVAFCLLSLSINIFLKRSISYIHRSCLKSNNWEKNTDT